MGCVPDSLMRSSKIVLAGEGGTVKDSTRLIEPTVGLTRTEEAELVRERSVVEKVSTPSGPSEARRDFQREEMVDIRELMRERPLAEKLSERLFLGEWGISMPASERS